MPARKKNYITIKIKNSTTKFMSRTGFKVTSKNKIQKSASQKSRDAQKLHVADFERVFWSPFCEMFHNITSETHNGISYTPA